MLLGTWHFSWTVSDLDRSLSFYCGDLGLELVHQQENHNEYTEKLVGLPGARLKAALLKFASPAGPSGHVIELVEYVHPKGVKLDGTPCNVGAAHMAFLTSDVHSMYERLNSKGVRFVSPPVAIASGINQGGYTCYLKDPDNFTLEMLQPPEARLEAARAAFNVPRTS